MMLLLGFFALFLSHGASNAFCPPATLARSPRTAVPTKLSLSDQTPPSNADNNIDDYRANLLSRLGKDFAVLREIRPPNPANDTSAPVAIISAGSSYTRFWTRDTWKEHSKPPHLRYFRHARRWIYSTTTRKIFPTVVIASVWAGMVSLVARRSVVVGKMLPSAGSSAVLSYLAAPLGLLLTLRANQSMNRLLEARQAWGRLVLRSRSLANVANVYLYPMNPKAALLVIRHLATLGWVLKSSVRGEPIDSDRQVLKTMLSEDSDDYAWLIQQPQRANAILSRMRQIIVGTVMTTATAAANETRVANTLLVAEGMVEGLEQVVGICARLTSSPIPPTYTRHLSRTMFLWLFFMPASLVSSGLLSTFGVMAATFAATYVLVGIDEVGMEIENSFQLLPLQQLAAAVQNAVENQILPTGGPMPPVPPPL